MSKRTPQRTYQKLHHFQNSKTEMILVKWKCVVMFSELELKCGLNLYSACFLLEIFLDKFASLHLINSNIGTVGVMRFFRSISLWLNRSLCANISNTLFENGTNCCFLFCVYDPHTKQFSGMEEPFNDRLSNEPFNLITMQWEGDSTTVTLWLLQRKYDDLLGELFMLLYIISTQITLINRSLYLKHF